MIALLIVHGIGEQRRGQTTEKLLVGLKVAYGDARPFRWFGAETLGVRVQNGMALFTLFGWTTGMLLHTRDRRNEAKQTCESARRSSG